MSKNSSYKRRRIVPRTAAGKAALTVALVLVSCAVIFFQPILESFGVDAGALMAWLWAEPAVSAPVDGELQVHFIDVGQASSTLILHDGTAILIDGAEKKNAASIVEYLRAHSVERLDYFFNSHPHSDHMGGCRDIMDAIPTTRFYMTNVAPEAVPTTSGYKKLLEYLDANRDTVQTVFANAGDSYQPAQGMNMEVIAPVKLYSDLNDASLVIRLDYGDVSFLFPGDMEAASQRDLMDAGGVQPVTVLCAPHHGSSTSIDSGFMRRLSPEYSVISCGADNDYGHPHAETIKLYNDMGITYYRTDRQGSIVASTDGTNLTFTTERSE